jgi:hypothetical protein
MERGASGSGLLETLKGGWYASKRGQFVRYRQPTIQPTKSDVLYDLRVVRQSPRTCKLLKSLSGQD